MNLTEKQLLTKDICSRLNYSLKCKVAILDSKELYTIIDIDLGQYPDMVMVRVENSRGSRIECPIEEVKPYLRPMSSMTEKEKKELYYYYCKEIGDNLNTPNLTWELRCCVYNSFGNDWLNKGHFDYRGLIPKGLAIEVTNEDNPYKEKLTTPDKIYLKPLLTEEGDSIVRRCTFEKLSDSQIEYVRADAFIEKACKWLNENITNNPNANSVLVRNGCVTLEMLVEDFKKHMEE